MTLRARLATAFFAVLLGPAVSGAYLAWTFWPRPLAGPDPAALVQRLVAECAHLSATAQGYAAAGVTRTSDVAGPGAASAGGSASAGPDVASAGGSASAGPGAASAGGSASAGPWVICGPTATRPLRTPVLAPAGTRYVGLAARAEITGPDGTVTGYAYAVRPLDADFLGQLSVAANGTVTLLDVGAPGAVDGLALPLGLTAGSAAGDRGGWLTAAVATAVLLAVGLGWWLAGLTTRPLTVLLRAVERVAAGDLTARSQLGGRDETGRLGTGLDRLIARLQETLQLSVTDPLTGLGNVRQLGDALRRESERATRFGRTLGVLMLDLDHFKTVNDRFGHRAGDAVLVEFAQRVRRVVREVDLPFRQGGEEFVILLPETDVAGSLTAARRIGEAVREAPFPLPGTDIIVTVSVGVAVFPRHARTAAGIVDAADVALYAAKHAGRDTFALAEVAFVSTPARLVPAPARPGATPVRLADAGGASGGTTSPRTSPAG